MEDRLILCLGNQLLGDDAFGAAVARRLGDCPAGGVAVRYAEASGLALLDHLYGARRLVVVDTLRTAHPRPGRLRILRETDLPAPGGGALHAHGLREVLALARRLGLPVPDEIVLITVEAADAETFGKPLHHRVAAAVEAAARLALKEAGGPP
jgi:hydrogenase maturation protease